MARETRSCERRGVNDYHPDLEALVRCEAIWSRAGWYPLPEGWWEIVVRGLVHPSRAPRVVRAGRRGGKSSTTCRLACAAVAAACADRRVHPAVAGDIPEIVIVSAQQEQARRRLETIVRGLQIIAPEIGCALRPRVDVCDVATADGESRIRIVSYAATTRAVVGMTCALAICDEYARWRGTTAAHPGEEIVSSLHPATLTDPYSSTWLISSPWDTSDPHAQAYDAADPELRWSRATWELRADISEEQTRALEPDPRRWAREYAAVPMSGSDVRYYPGWLLPEASA